MIADDIKALREALPANRFWPTARDFDLYIDNEAASEFIAAANPERIARLVEHVEALEADARRYRTLRNSLPGYGEPAITTFDMPDVRVPMHPEQGYLRHGLDDALDKAAAALAQTGEKP